MDWKIILILVVLVGIILIIRFYSCPSRDHNILWRPESDSYKAPNIEFTNSDGSSLKVPYIGCSDVKDFSIYWVCDYSTTIYNPSTVHFNLATIATLSNGIATSLLPINNNISPSDSNVVVNDTDNPVVRYTYTYKLGEEDSLKPGGYTLYINSFVPQGENVPKGQKADSDITEGNMVVYDSKVEDVRDITINGCTEDCEVYITDDLTVAWERGLEKYEPSPEINYTVTLKSEENGTLSSQQTRDLYFVFKSETVPVGTYKAVVQAHNLICNTSSNRVSSEPFIIEQLPVPVPTIISSTSFSNLSCTYTSKISACDNNDLIIYWCVDFTDYPEYNPKKSGDPDFIINITGDSTNNFQLKDVVEDSDDGNIFFYKYNFGNVEAGIYTITLTTYSPYNGGDKYLSDPSKATTYTVQHNPNPPYKIPDGGIYYDRNPPIYKTNDTMVLTWDPPPNSVGVYPDPSKEIQYNWYIKLDDGNSFSCGVGSRRSATITLKDGAAKSCNPSTYSFTPGEYSLNVQTNMFYCNPPKQTTYAPNFTVVECLEYGDCPDGDVCADNTCQASG